MNKKQKNHVRNERDAELLRRAFGLLIEIPITMKPPDPDALLKWVDDYRNTLPMATEEQMRAWAASNTKRTRSRQKGSSK